jgi:hypothetical protein
MEPADQIQEHEKKIRHLEQELNDLRQGLAVVTDYYCELKRGPAEQAAAEVVISPMAKPPADEDVEFDAIWKFHEEVLVADPGARVPCTAMYDAFAQFCSATGRTAVEQEAFEFVFAHMENPVPSLDRGEWVGYRIRPEMLRPR